MPPDASIDRVVDLLRSTQNLLFITGAGFSADSGLPTYYQYGGLYNDLDTEERETGDGPAILTIHLVPVGTTLRLRNLGAARNGQDRRTVP